MLSRLKSLARMMFNIPLAVPKLGLRVLMYVALGVTILLGLQVVKAVYLWTVEHYMLVTPNPQPPHRYPPVQLPSTTLAEKAPRKPVTRVVSQPQLTHKQMGQVEERYHLDLNVVDFLNEVKVPPAAYGGTEAITIDRDGNTTAVFRPSRRPVFELGHSWEVGAGITLDPRGQGWTVYGARDLARVGPITLKLQGSITAVGTSADGSVSLLGVYRHN